MAPYNLLEIHPLKRSSVDGGFDELNFPSKKHISLIRHHSLRWRPQSIENASEVCQNQEAVQSILSRSIALALDVVGFRHAEPTALESFRAHVEAYMVHFLASVKQSMLSSRRTQPISQDFLYALNTHRLTLTSLLTHLDPPVIPSRSQLDLAVESPEIADPPRQSKLIGHMLNGDDDEAVRPYLQTGFPPLPSRHTYKAQPVFANREQDPRKIRECATEEGRLGEEALRRLVTQGTEGGNVPDAIHKLRRLQETARNIWAEAMHAVSGKGKGKLGSPVNADRIYWRKPVVELPSSGAIQGIVPKVVV